MATYVSVIYHRWSSKCFQTMAQAEKILEAIAANSAVRAEEIDRLSAETRDLIAESREIRDGIDAAELRRIARDSLDAAERLRAVIESAHLPDNHPLAQLYDEFADHAEVLALSADPCTSADLNAAVSEARDGESIPWDRLREKAG